MKKPTEQEKMIVKKIRSLSLELGETADKHLSGLKNSDATFIALEAMGALMASLIHSLPEGAEQAAMDQLSNSVNNALNILKTSEEETPANETVH